MRSFPPTHQRGPSWGAKVSSRSQFFIVSPISVLLWFWGPLFQFHLFLLSCSMLDNFKIASLNVNGLGNPLKRKKKRVLEKLKKGWLTCGFSTRDTFVKKRNKLNFNFPDIPLFYSTCSNSRQRRVTTLISNLLNFDFLDEVGDKVGRYLSKGELIILLSH